MSGYAALAHALFTGAAAPSWATRNTRTRALLEAVYGPKAGVPEAHAPVYMYPIVPPAAARQRLDRFVKAQVTHLLAGRFSAVAPHLDEAVWVLWPDNTFVCHEGAELQAKLIDRPNALSLEPTAPRSYAGAEARAAFARGIPEALDVLFPLANVLLYTFAVGEHGRVMVVVRPTEDGGRLASLLLPSVDDAWAFSVRTSLDESPPLRIAQTLVRRVCLGHFTALRAMTLDLMPGLWVGDTFADRDRFIALAGDGEHRLDGAEQIFGASVPGADLAATVGGPLAKTIERESEAKWFAPLDALRPMLVETRVAWIDPNTLGVGDESSVHTLLLETKEDDGAGGDRSRWRVGGWFEG